MTPEQRLVAKRIENEAVDYVLARTVAIYAAARGGRLVAHGSGVLLKIADAAFILSAAHVFDEDNVATNPALDYTVGKDDGRALYVGTGPGDPPVSLEGFECQVTHDREDSDFAFFRLNPATEAAIGAHKEFLRLDQVDLPASKERSGYCVAGYPVSFYTGPDEHGVFDSKPASIMTALHEHALVSFTDRVSIAVSFPPAMMDDAGALVRPPDMRGISGCGIWRIIGATAWEHGQWEPSMIRLAGIEHTVIEREAIKGVLVHRVVATIRKAHRDLIPAIDLHGPQ